MIAISLSSSLIYATNKKLLAHVKLFDWFQKLFRLHYVFGWASPTLEPLVCHIGFVANLWTPWGSTFFVMFMVRKGWLHMMLCMMFLHLLQRMQDFTFYMNEPRSSIAYSLIFALTNRHCDFIGWFSDVG
jgi:hypothetical protein